MSDTDAVYRRALAAGATSVMEPADQFYGDRNGGVRDLPGNRWWIPTYKEECLTAGNGAAGGGPSEIAIP